MHHMVFQGDQTKKVGVIDSEFIVHQGIPSLGGPSVTKVKQTQIMYLVCYCYYLYSIFNLQGFYTPSQSSIWHLKRYYCYTESERKLITSIEFI